MKMAESLNSCSPNEEDVVEVLRGLGDRILEQDAVTVINNMVNPETAYLALRYFQHRLKLSREVILYNVTLKVFRECRDFDRAEKLFDEMLERGVKPVNTTFSRLRENSMGNPTCLHPIGCRHTTYDVFTSS